MSKITTHILDTAGGCPATGVRVTLWTGEVEIARGITNKDGRILDWPDADAVREVDRAQDAGNGIYKIRFETRDYFDKQGVASFYPWVDIYFEVGAEGHYHVPLLISPYGYSTYRGS
ncbi:MAG TPA: hydroxyisourate hydrolase [Puia sp.]